MATGTNLATNLDTGLATLTSSYERANSNHEVELLLPGHHHFHDPSGRSRYCSVRSAIRSHSAQDRLDYHLSAGNRTTEAFGHQARPGERDRGQRRRLGR